MRRAISDSGYCGGGQVLLGCVIFVYISGSQDVCGELDAAPRLAFEVVWLLYAVRLSKDYDRDRSYRD